LLSLFLFFAGWWWFSFVFAGLGIEPRALCMLGKQSTWFSERGSCCVAQAGLVFVIFLVWPSKCWDYSWSTPGFWRPTSNIRTAGFAGMLSYNADTIPHCVVCRWHLPHTNSIWGCARPPLCEPATGQKQSLKYTKEIRKKPTLLCNQNKIQHSDHWHLWTATKEAPRMCRMQSSVSGAGADLSFPYCHPLAPT
jgi:hypothetical protein